MSAALGEAGPSLPEDEQNNMESGLQKRASWQKSQLAQKKSQADLILPERSLNKTGTFSQPQDSDAEDSDPESDPEDPKNSALGAQHEDQGQNIEKDREELLKSLGQFTWETFELFTEAHEERLKRCYGADKRDQNRTIFHWLALKLWKNSISVQYLEWLVKLVIGYDPALITQTTEDSQKANCLHLAVQQKHFDFLECLCNEVNDESLKRAISQGNDCGETCLHLAIKLHPPALKVVSLLLDKADPKIIAKQRSCKFLDDMSEDLNTVLHDFAHIDRCFATGYMKILKRLINDCPKAMKIQNKAKETPFQFHLATRDKRYPELTGLEFSKQDGTGPKRIVAAAKAGQHLLNEAFSQSSYEDACACIYGDKQFDRAISFQPASPINTRIDQSHKFLNFYPILSYVELTLVDLDSTGSNRDATVQPAGTAELPSRNVDPPHEAWRIRTDSVTKVFSWLRKRSVQRILKVTVVDHTTFPCSDETIEQCLKNFDIRYLNWNKDDFCVDIFRKSALYNIKELWLSWSGRNSVLYSWGCKDTGLPSMKKLEIVHIDTKPGTESNERDKQNLVDFNRRLKDNISKLQLEQYRSGIAKKVTQTLVEDFEALRPKLHEALVQSDYARIARIDAKDPPLIEGTIANLDARINYHLKETKGLREIKVDDTTHENWIDGKMPRHRAQVQHGHRWVDAARRLATAINKDRLQSEKTMRPIKIALIDDGVTPGELSTPGALKEGWPLPSTRKRNASRPYYWSEKGHGTKMARLIQMMCPFVWIYVAKVDMCREEDPSVATSAAKAVDWAIEKQVDIISMSWTVKRIRSGQGENGEAITALDLAIQRAANSDIIMMCSVEDSSHYGVGDVYPQKSDTNKLIIVGSADENGDKSKFVNENSFNYLFPGEVMIPGMLALADVGSSVATAIAAGTAAMILWCAEYHSVSSSSSTNTVNSQALHGDSATTLSASMDIQGAPKQAPRTAPEWDFRKNRRMNALFNALKAANDKFVDVTNLINHAMKDIDDIEDVTVESQKTCTEAFITRCKENLPVDLRGV